MCGDNGRHIIASEHSPEKHKPFDDFMYVDSNHEGSDAKGYYTIEVTEPTAVTKDQIRKRVKEYFFNRTFDAYQLGLDDYKRKAFFEGIEISGNIFKLNVKYGDRNTWVESDFRAKVIEAIQKEFGDVILENEQRLINETLNASLYYD